MDGHEIHTATAGVLAAKYVQNFLEIAAFVYGQEILKECPFGKSPQSIDQF